MAVNFPTSPSNGDTITSGDSVYTYSSSKGYWLSKSTISGIQLDSLSVTTTSASGSGSVSYNNDTGGFTYVPPVIGAGSTVTVYATAADLPLSGNTAGDQAYVTATNRLYIWTGTGWYNIALINTSPSITTGSSAAYTLANDGTATVITLVATDPEEVPITWSYAVTTGSLGSTATVSQSGNVFTITPSTVESNAGTFSLTFTASDGVNTDTSTSAFTLSFGFSGTLTHTIYNPSPNSSDRFGRVTAASEDYVVTSAYNASTPKVYVYSASSGSLLHTISDSTSNFGFALALDGDILVVGGMHGYQGVNPEKVMIYDISTFSSSTINSPNYTIQNPNVDGVSVSSYPDQFGYSNKALAISGDMLAIAANMERGSSSVNNDGKVYVYDISGFSSSTITSADYTLNNPNSQGTGANDYFAQSLAMDGDNLICGTNNEDSASMDDDGVVYYYDMSTWSSSTPSPTYTVTNPNVVTSGGGGDNFGKSVAISGSKWVASAPYEDTSGSGGDSIGAVYVFNVSNGNLLHRINGIAARKFIGNDSLCLDGNDLLIPSGGTYPAKYIHQFNVSSLSGTATTISTSDSGIISNPGELSPNYNQWPGEIYFKGGVMAAGAQYEDDTDGSGGTSTNSGVLYVWK
jgi:hypothetical protein